MKEIEPKVKMCVNSSFQECISKFLFNKVIIKDNVDDFIDLSDYSFDECIFDGIDFTNININDISLIDVVFRNCDLSNKHFNNTFVSRVSFINCKLTGVSFVDSSLRDVKIESSLCLYMNYSSNINGLSISDSNLLESSFNSCNLVNSYFSNVNFSKCNFLDCNLKGVDFSTSVIDNICFDIKSLNGITINRMDAFNIVSMFNVKVKD